MNKINNIGLSRELTSCYDFQGFTEQEVWSRIAQKINIIIEHFNYLDTKIENEKANNKAKFEYLLGEGLNESVSKIIIQKISDGTIGELINGTLLKEINDKVDDFQQTFNEQLDKITLLASTFGILADGTDETEKLKELLTYVDSRSDINKVIFPKGTIVINDSMHFLNTLNRPLKICGFNTELKLANQSRNFHEHKPMACVYNNIDFSGFEFDGNFDNNYYTVNGERYHSYIEGENSSSGITKGSIAILLVQANYTKIHKCEFKDISWSSCDIASGNNIEIYDNIFYNGAQDYIPVHNANNVYVHDNKCYYPNNHALHAYSNCKNVVFDNNDIIYENKYFKQYKKVANIGICVDHSLYPLSEVLNTTITNNRITVDASIKNVHGISFAGYPNTVNITNNDIDVTGIGIFMMSPTLGLTRIQYNKIKSTDISIYYRVVENHGSIAYECDNKTGEITIENNNLYCESNACLVIKTSTDIPTSIVKQIIRIKDNTYHNNAGLKNIHVNSIDSKYEIYIDEPITDNLINTNFDVNNNILGKLFIGKNYIKNLWVNNSFSIPSIQNDGHFIPALMYSRANGTVKLFTVESTNAGKPKLLFNTDGIPTTHSSLQYTIDSSTKFEDKYIFISLDVRSLSEHNIIIEIIRDGEKPIRVYQSDILSQTDYKVRKLVYIPKVVNQNLRNTFKLQILIDSNGETFNRLQYFSISDPKIIEGCCINHEGDLINDNTIHSVNKLINKPLIIYGSTIPLNGNFVRGDRIINISPSNESPKSWVCITSGNPGVWVNEK